MNNRLDDAIDRALRDMMHVDPRPGLSRRVHERLSEPRTGWLTPPRLASATALIVALVVTVLLVTRTTGPVQQPAPAGRAAHSDSRADAPASPAAAAATAQPVSVVRRDAKRVTVHSRYSAPGVSPPFASSVHVEPLPSVPPIAMTSVGPRPLEAQGITVQPLAPIEPLHLDPLSSMPH